MKNYKLIVYNILSITKAVALTFLFLFGLGLMFGEPIQGDDNEMKILILTKVCGVLALYVSYLVFNGALNRMKE
jgi:hypothetical protein